MKNTLSKYGWIIALIIIVAVQIAVSQASSRAIKDAFIESVDRIVEEMNDTSTDADIPADTTESDEGKTGGDPGTEGKIQLPADATATDLRSAVSSASDSATIVLGANETINMGAGNMHFLGKAMKNADGTGKALAIDLNGGSLVSTEAHSNGWYYGLEIPDGADIVIANGTIELDMWDAQNYPNQNEATSAITVGTGASLTLKNVHIKSNSAAIFPSGTASQLIVENCTIEGNAYAIATNRMESSIIKISVKDSKIKAASCAFLINCASNTTISNCEVEAGGWALFLRAGTANISNTNFKTTDGDVGYNSAYSCSYKNFKYTQNRDGAPYWGTGFQCPYSVVTLGDYSNGDSYSGDVVCSMTGVTITSPNSADIPTVLCAAQREDKVVKLTYSGTSNIGEVVVFGQNYDYTTNNHSAIVHSGSILVNGAAVALN